MKKRKLAAWIVLTIIAVIAAFCLALTNEVTEDVIKQQAVADAEAARKTRMRSKRWRRRASIRCTAERKTARPSVTWRR